jgi:DNA primase
MQLNTNRSKTKMAKISPVSIKYMIHANFRVEGALEKPDVIGAIFGQTEGLLGSDLEMRELQKEGKIGRIEVELERKDKLTTGIIKIPTALDQSETTLIAAAVETIEKMGPCDAQIEVEKIEDVRGSKRDYIIERAKKLMVGISGQTDSREISKEIKDSARTSEIKEYGEEKLPCGDLSENEIFVVEGRADVLNMLRAGVKNVIAMNGTKLPESIRKLSQEKEITLFVDGDRGGKLIIQNVLDNARIKYIAIAPDGKEVEELQGKEILMTLRRKMTVSEYLGSSRESSSRSSQGRENSSWGSQRREEYSNEYSNKNSVEEAVKEEKEEKESASSKPAKEESKPEATEEVKKVVSRRKTKK